MSENIEPASPAPPAFTPEEEHEAYRQMLLFAASRRRPGSCTAWG